MSCDKCQGLIITEHGESRCLNCGRRPLERNASIMAPRPERAEMKVKRTLVTWTPERREKFMATMAAKRNGSGSVKQKPSQTAQPKKAQEARTQINEGVR